MRKVITFQDGNQLYITDEPELLRALLADGKYAIPLYTDENRGLSFPHTDYAVTDLDALFHTTGEADTPLTGTEKNGDAAIPEALTRIYRRLAGLPWDILETERMTVRETTVADVDAFYEIYRDPAVTAYMDALFDNPEAERLYTRNYIRDIYGFYGYGMWTVLDKNTGVIIGRAGITNRDGCDFPELGFLIRKEYRRQGRAYEVCRAILRYAKEELHFSQIQALTMPENTASVTLLTRLGFQKYDEMPLNGIPHIRYFYQSQI